VCQLALVLPLILQCSSFVPPHKGILCLLAFVVEEGVLVGQDIAGLVLWYSSSASCRQSRLQSKAKNGRPQSPTRHPGMPCGTAATCSLVVTCLPFIHTPSLCSEVVFANFIGSRSRVLTVSQDTHCSLTFRLDGCSARNCLQNWLLRPSCGLGNPCGSPHA
jgi:hypothetical protein